MATLGLGVKARRKKRFNVASIPNCEWWIDASRTDTHSYASGVNLTQVNDLSGKNRHMTKTGAGNETVYPTYVAAEKGILFLNTAFDQMIAGAIGDWNFMHNGNGCTIMMLVKVDSAMAANAVMLSTSSEASTGVGTNLWYYNTNQQYNVTTRNGSAQVFLNSGANNSLNKNVPTLLSVFIESRSGNPPDLVTRYNGATDIQTGNLTTFSTSNSTGPLFVGKLPDAVFKCKMVFKKCAIFSRRITKAEENLILEDWTRDDGITLTRYGERSLAVISGQSNATGRGAISETSFAATPTVSNVQIFNSNGFSWATLQAGVNNAALDSNSLGLEMNLAKQFISLSGKNLNLVKSTADGTSMTSWTSTNNNFINLQAAMKRAYWQLEDAGYVVKPFFIWYQGESDAQDNSLAASYAGNLQTFLTQILNINGFQQAPTFVVQTHQSPAYSGTDTVRAAQLTTTMTTPFSAYTRLVEIDDIVDHLDQNHVKADTLNALGNRIAHRVLGIAE